MNLMTDMWMTFGRDAGQIVTRSYRYDEAANSIVMRITDASDGSVEYAAAECPDDVEWVGSESEAPWDDDLEFRPLAGNPFAEGRSER